MRFFSEFISKIFWPHIHMFGNPSSVMMQLAARLSWDTSIKVCDITSSLLTTTHDSSGGPQKMVFWNYQVQVTRQVSPRAPWTRIRSGRSLSSGTLPRAGKHLTHVQGVVDPEWIWTRKHQETNKESSDFSYFKKQTILCTNSLGSQTGDLLRD